MSKISITPNTAGTGTFTITSPATNTDRTLTLPDTGGSVVLNEGSGTFKIDALGNVGIGTSSPSSALQVAGTVTATSFSGPLTGAVTGNAATATALQTARTINGVSFNGTANITVADSTKAPIASPTFTGTVTAPSATIGGILLENSSDRTGLLEINRLGTTSWTGIQAKYSDTALWSIMGDETNFGLYDDSLGEWALQYTENAGVSLYYNSVVKLQTTNTGATTTGTHVADTFNATSTVGGGFQGIDADSAGVPSFTWTSDLNTGIWHLGADQIGFTTAGVNRLSLTTTALTSTLGIAAPTFTGALTGNATTATTLQTARTIGGVSFNGSANINLPGVNTAGNQSTTGNAATATTLQTARTIALSGDVTGSVSFNGSANATISAQIAANVVGANELNVSGNGTTAQYLRSDGDGTFTWATPIAMGVGQTWQAVTRAAGTVYQNTTGRPIQLGINQYGLDGQLYIGLTSNPTQSIYWNNASGAGRYEQNHCNSIIPAGYYYKMTGAINGWNELR